MVDDKKKKTTTEMTDHQAYNEVRYNVLTRMEQLLRQAERKIQTKSSEMMRTEAALEQSQRVSDAIFAKMQQMEESGAVSYEGEAIDAKTQSTYDALMMRLGKADEHTMNIKERMEKQIARRLSVAKESLIGQVQTQTGISSIDRDIMMTARRPEYQSKAMYRMQNIDYTAAETMLQKVKRRILEHAPEVADAAQLIDTPEGRERYIREAEKHQMFIRSGANMQSILMQYQRQRMDPGSVLTDSSRLIRTIETEENRQRRVADIAGGKYGTLEEERSKLGGLHKDFTDAYHKFTVALHNGSKDVGALSKSVHDLSKQYQEQAQVIKDMQRMGAGGGDEGLFRRMMGILGGDYMLAGARGAQAVGDAMLYHTVTMPIQKMGVQRGIADISNMGFEDWYNAPTNATSARRLLSNFQEQRLQLARDIQKDSLRSRALILGGSLGETVVHAGRTAAAALDPTSGGVGAGAAKIAAGATGVAAVGSAAAQTIAQTALPMAQHYKTGVGLLHNIQPGADAIQAVGALNALDTAINAIGDRSLQTTLDHYKAMTLATRGLGGAGGISGGTVGARSLGGGWRGDDISDIVSKLEPPQLDKKPENLRGFAEYIQQTYQSGARGKALNDIRYKGTEQEKRWATRLLTSADAFGVFGTSTGSGSYTNVGNVETALNLAAGKEISPLRDVQGRFTVGTVGKQSVQEVAGQPGGGSAAMGGTVADPIYAGSGRREEFMRFLMDPRNMQDLADRAGLGSEDIARIINAGKTTLGAELGISDIERSGTLARAGYLDTPEQYIQAKGILSQVGAAGVQGDERFADILAGAIAAKIDSSKNIMALVQSTARIADRSALRGIDVTGGASEMMLRSVQSLLGTGISPTLAGRMAENAAMMANQFAGSTEMDIPNLVEAANIRREFKGISVAEQELLQRMEPAEIAEIKSRFERVDAEQDPEKKKQLRSELDQTLANMGMLNVFKSTQDVNKAQYLSTKQVMDRTLGLGTGIYHKEAQRISEYISQGGDPSKLSLQDQNIANQLGLITTDKRTIGVGVASTMAGPIRRGQILEAPTTGSVTGGGEDLLKTTAIRDAELIKSGVDGLNKAVGGLTEFADKLNTAIKAFPLDKAAEQTKEAAKENKIPMTDFKELTTALKEVSSSVKEMTTELNKANRVRNMPGGNTDHTLRKP